MLAGKRILLIIGGGIAAYKCLDLIRRLREREATVRVIMTEAAKQFVTPLSLASLSGDKVYDDMFDLTDETEIGHIQLSRDADVLVVAPATADIMAKMANGLSSDLATTCLLATDKPVLMAPAMNVRMWEHPASQRNVRTLIGDGVRCVGPNEGDMACGEYGPGRMAEPAEIIEALNTHFGGTLPPLHELPLQGKTVLITAGPTHEPIDPVRYIANRSSGKQGYAIAEAALELGARTLVVSGPVRLLPPPGAEVIPVESAREMLGAVEDEMPVDAAIFAAAVADWGVAEPGEQKMKKDGSGAVPPLELSENPDILATVAKMKKNRPALVVGFAAETENVIDNARAKLEKKGCDWIVANDVSPDEGVFGGSENTVHLITGDGVENWPRMEKAEVARRLMERVADRILDADASVWT
ncbi:MAG: bifunctional phosphopantothenoylcysteine decarboxylase/phosphopantothenate--cysteine ligase CoaBC [Pseudomonadota bacterium]